MIGYEHIALCALMEPMAHVGRQVFFMAIGFGLQRYLYLQGVMFVFVYLFSKSVQRRPEIYAIVQYYRDVCGFDGYGGDVIFGITGIILNFASRP